jgi:tetratricopeptide (TPR) repeat protein
MVNPKYKIFMDMEVPFLFADEDFFMAHHAFGNEEVLSKILWQYDPSFISVPILSERFKDIIKKFPDYELVFFDYAEVLYLNKRHYPEIAAKYRIKDIDPFELSSKSIDAALRKTSKDSLLQDLDKLLQIYPDCLLKNQIMAMAYNKGGEYKKAVSYADAVIRSFPESPVGYRVKGDALTGMKLYEEALSFYQMALQRLDKEGKRGVYKQVGFVYAEKKQNDQAYRALKKAIDPFAAETTYKDLFDLGALALSVGEAQEALTLLRFAQTKVPPEDTLWLGKIQKHLAMIKIEGEK